MVSSSTSKLFLRPSDSKGRDCNSPGKHSGFDMHLCRGRDFGDFWPHGGIKSILGCCCSRWREHLHLKVSSGREFCQVYRIHLEFMPWYWQSIEKSQGRSNV